MGAAMSAFPVTLILRPFLGREEPLQILCNMMGHSTAESAVAATPREPGDKVRFFVLVRAQLRRFPATAEFAMAVMGR
jgi:hypothetical protein